MKVSGEGNFFQLFELGEMNLVFTFLEGEMARYRKYTYAWVLAKDLAE